MSLCLCGKKIRIFSAFSAASAVRFFSIYGPTSWMSGMSAYQFLSLL